MRMLEANSLSKTYSSDIRKVTALRNASFSVESHEVVALMGPSGCGKSTLLKQLGLLSKPTSGSLTIKGLPAPTQERQRARTRNGFFGYLHQSYAIIDDDTVAANIAIPLEYAKPRLKSFEQRRAVENIATSLGLEENLRTKARHLSGGQRQRVAIARALVNNPTVVLADEPTAALDSVTADMVLSLLLDIASLGGAVVLATHDPRVAERCDRILCMRDGNLINP